MAAAYSESCSRYCGQPTSRLELFVPELQQRLSSSETILDSSARVASGCSLEEPCGNWRSLNAQSISCFEECYGIGPSRSGTTYPSKPAWQYAGAAPEAAVRFQMRSPRRHTHRRL